jgi:1-acyl-sn-glycerol-3-phosphate acyltransferase
VNRAFFLANLKCVLLSLFFISNSKIQQCKIEINQIKNMLKLIAQWYFKWIAWKIEGSIPPDIKKCVIVAAPHTSNYDYPITISVFYILGIPVRFLGKKQLFSFPLGILMRATGGIAVDRSKKNNLVEYMIRLFEENESLFLLIPPEGTRSAVNEWKTGFYRVAEAAQVPIVLGYLDYKKKIAGFGNIFYPTGDLEKDMKEIKAFYKNITPKYPEKYRLE